jgi:methyl-accepting chemotaxis protein
MFGTFSVGKKIAFALGVVVIGLGIVGSISFLGVGRIVADAEEVICGNQLDAEMGQREIDHLNWINKVNKVVTDDTVTTLNVQLDDHKCGLGKWLYGPARKEAQTRIPALTDTFKAMEKPHADLHASAGSIAKSLLTDRAAAKNTYDNETVVSLELVQSLLGEARGIIKSNIITEEAMLASAQTTQILVGTAASAGIVLGLILSFMVTRGIARSLKRIIGEVREGSDNLSSSAGQVSSASQSLAQTTNEQAASVDQITGRLSEITTQLGNHATSAIEAEELATTAADRAESGTDAIGRMNNAIDEIKTSADETAKIIRTIDEIAFQTNLLALNAAVEAARAGESGKGFAVVAEEVRSLAKRSAQAARETADMIDQSVTRAGRGVEIGQEVAGLFSELSNASGTVKSLISNISGAINQQSQSIGQMNSTVAEMDRTTQANAATSEEAAAAAEELAAQADELTGAVGDLEKLTTGHITRHARPARPAAPQRRPSYAQPTAFRTDTSAHKPQSVQHKDAGPKCWDVKKCGRTPGGGKVAEMGVCPAYPDNGAKCWAVAGTFCGGKVQGNAADKSGGCLVCNFYKDHQNAPTATTGQASAATNTPSAAEPNCWDIKKCGRTPGGDKVAEMGVCPAYPSMGRNCWAIAGTFCGGKVQGNAADKSGGCLVCNFYKDLHKQKAQAAVS